MESQLVTQEEKTKLEGDLKRMIDQRVTSSPGRSPKPAKRVT